MFAVNPVANALGSSYSVLFTCDVVTGPLLPCNCLGAAERMHLRREHFLGCFSGDFVCCCNLFSNLLFKHTIVNFHLIFL